MTDKCAWIINLGANDAPAQAAAMQLAQYGLTPKGQRWPTDNENAWMTSAQEAAEANAAIVILIGSAQELSSEKKRRDLALFRLSLQALQRAGASGTINRLAYAGRCPLACQSGSSCSRTRCTQMACPPWALCARALRRVAGSSSRTK